MRIVSHFGVGPCILMYHAVSDNTNEAYSVSIDCFQKQLTWLNDHGFQVIPLITLLELLQQQDYNNLRKKVVITFDDGYKDFFSNALPMLLEHKATATVFLVTDMLGGASKWNPHCDDAPLMSEEEVRYIKTYGISLGSHTSTHVNLTKVSYAELMKQLKDSYSALTHLGESFYTLAYPYGQWSHQVSEAIMASGYECALAVGENTRMISNDKFFLPRIIMRRDMDLISFQSALLRTGIKKEIRRQYRKLRSSIFSRQT